MEKIMMICTLGPSTNYIYNHVSRDFHVEAVIVVQKENRQVFLKKRIKRLGLLKVIGQIIFVLYSKIFMAKKVDSRVKEIQWKFNLNPDDITAKKITHVHSVNSEEMKCKIREVDPDLIIINGTPIIKEDVLSVTDARFVNVHVGITPKYRGVHGAYWALYNNDDDLVGVTTHFVDKGIDSGEVLDQKVVKVDEADNFLTYSHLQIAHALLEYNKIIQSVLNDRFIIKEPITGESAIWSHPTIVSYLYGRIFKKVR
ncbi:formyl transferase [Salinicoccus hispanicus]|uniref:phosphoribosylglycinamide formyltransferase 1 n=1 Tax=Salinicoccus hispanicus TaxID=157225 RepID=A0A6N8TZK7_9STAP|nr:formyl transferase [Salinicoccus hispanicus]MXQ50993.1 formyl transferase [Salinicoccus hispanicus]